MSYRKITKLASSSPYVDAVMSRLCPGDHQHQHLEGKIHYADPDGIRNTIHRTLFAGWYTPEFCHAVLHGFEEQFSRQGSKVYDVYPATAEESARISAEKQYRRKYPNQCHPSPLCDKVLSNAQSVKQHPKSFQGKPRKTGADYGV